VQCWAVVVRNEGKLESVSNVQVYYLMHAESFWKDHYSVANGLRQYIPPHRWNTHTVSLRPLIIIVVLARWYLSNMWNTHIAPPRPLISRVVWAGWYPLNTWNAHIAPPRPLIRLKLDRPPDSLIRLKQAVHLGGSNMLFRGCCGTSFFVIVPQLRGSLAVPDSQKATKIFLACTCPLKATR